ncbi:MAG: hypothetical protein EA382_15750 [Spirochaetaceae bacterium]|nr:MAG: hypothetical protein EA382_15750 [Spirochaetaceae bacterium]
MQGDPGPARTRAEGRVSVPVTIGDRLELFVDTRLVDRMDAVSLRLHEPCPAPLANSPLLIAYTTVIVDGGRYRAWYRSIDPGYSGDRYDGNPGESTHYAESLDGHEWDFPRNTAILRESPFSHNFAPFLDDRPGVPTDERFKALAGLHDRSIAEIRRHAPGLVAPDTVGGLYAFGSPDGFTWRRLCDQPVIRSHAAGGYGFDSQNVAFWSEAEGCYVCFLRTWETPHGELRTISRSTSMDFESWTEPIPTNANLPGEHLYTSATRPYFRAPHIYLALPTRLVPDRGDSTDILFMSMRAGESTYERPFTDAFIRPGMDPARWGNRSNYVAHNVVPTGPTELSIYHKSGHRYTLRTDGFVSVHAGVAPGELTTVPVVFDGNELVVNASTSAAGSLAVEVQRADGSPVDGFALSDCRTVTGDGVEIAVRWAGDADLSRLSGTPVRLRFVMRECDLYSYRFRNGTRSGSIPSTFRM